MNKKGFTLIELLAVVVVLGVLTLIAVPTMSVITNTAKRKAFFVNISGIVRNVDRIMVLNEYQTCKLGLTSDEDPNDLVPDKDYESFLLIAYRQQSSSKILYKVEAKSKDGKYEINTNSFNDLDVNKSDEWNNHDNNLSDFLTWLLSQAFGSEEELPIC